MKALKPRVAFQVDNTLTNEGKLNVDLTFVDRFTHQIRHYPHYKRKLDFAFRTINLYVVLDLYAGYGDRHKVWRSTFTAHLRWRTSWQ
jgi:hypothetical protein